MRTSAVATSIHAVSAAFILTPLSGSRYARAKSPRRQSRIAVIPSVARDLGGWGLEDRSFEPPPTQVPRYARDDTTLECFSGEDSMTKPKPGQRPTEDML